MSERKRLIGRVTAVDVKTYGRAVVLDMSFRYTDGSGQGFARLANTELLNRFMGVFNVEALQETIGETCWVTFDYGAIYTLSPIFPGEGEGLDFEELASVAEEANE